MRKYRGAGAAAVVLALALWLVPSALAQSTDVYPAGDSVSASSMSVALSPGGITCTFNPGVFALPAKGNPSGPEVATFSTRPTLTKCSSPSIGEWTSETSGTWKLTIQYGTGAANITIPAGGIRLTGFGGAFYFGNEAEAWTWTGVWNNGFTSPVKVSSSWALYPSKNTEYVGGKPTEATLGSYFSTLTDTTQPGSLLLLGP